MIELLLNLFLEGKISFFRKYVFVFIFCEILKFDLVDVFWLVFFFDI